MKANENYLQNDIDEATTWSDTFQQHLTPSEYQYLASKPKNKYLVDQENELAAAWAEIDQLIGELSDEPASKTAIQSTTTNPTTERKPKTVAVSVDVSKVTTKRLLDKITKIRDQAALGNYSEADRKILRSASKILTERDIPPVNRHYRKFKPFECKKNKSASDFMIDLQTFDLHWVWHHHRGHTTPWFEENPPLKSHHNGTTHNKEWASIFSSEKFDWELAKEIAVGEFMYSEDQYKPSKRHHADPKNDGALINITKAEKIKRLALPDYIQEKLSILQTEKLRLKSYESKKASLKEKDRIRDIKTKSMDIKRQLEINAAKSTSRMSVDGITTLVNVWVSLTIAKGSLTKAKIEYETLTGTIIDRHFIRNKKVALERFVRFA